LKSKNTNRKPSEQLRQRRKKRLKKKPGQWKKRKSLNLMFQKKPVFGIFAEKLKTALDKKKKEKK